MFHQLKFLFFFKIVHYTQLIGDCHRTTSSDEMCDPRKNGLNWPAWVHLQLRKSWGYKNCCQKRQMAMALRIELDWDKNLQKVRAVWHCSKCGSTLLKCDSFTLSRLHGPYHCCGGYYSLVFQSDNSAYSSGRRLHGFHHGVVILWEYDLGTV